LITGTGGLPVRPGDLPLPVFATGEVQGVEKAEEGGKAEGRGQRAEGGDKAEGRGQEAEGGDKAEGRGQEAEGESKIDRPAFIVEAQGVYRLPDGQVILSWECPR
jgi:hypothetical protein